LLHSRFIRCKPNLNSPGHRWPLRVGIVTLVAIAFSVGAVLVGGSMLLNVPAIKSQAARQLSQAANGHIAWDALRIRLLPAPHVEVRGVTIDIPGQVHARIEEAQVRLRLRPLFHGQVDFASIAVVRPVVRIDLSPSAPEQGQSSNDPVAAYRALLGPLLQAVRHAAPRSLLQIAEADVELRAPDTPLFQLRGMSLVARTDATGLELEASAASNFWDHLNLAGRIEFADLSANLSLEAAGVKAQAWLDSELAGGALGIEIPRGNLRGRFGTDASTDLHCDFGIDTAWMQFTRAGQKLPLSDDAVKGRAVLRAQGIEITLSELRLGSVVRGAHATLDMTGEAEKPRIALNIGRLDVGEVRDAVLALLGDKHGVRRYAPRVGGGEIRDLRLRTEADNWHGVLDLGHLAGSAELAHASFLLPAIEQEATELRGRVELSNAKLELAAASARLGPSELTDARLRYSIRDDATSASMGFDVYVPQALAIARHVQSDGQAGSLNDIESTAGRLRGHASFASATSDWNAGVEITRSDASIHLRSVPWPVSLQAVRASISPRQVRVSGLQGTMGRSNFSDLGATLALEPQLRVTSGSGRATLVLDEIYPWARSHLESSKFLNDIDSIAGSVQITLNSLSGTPGQPSALLYDVTVRPEHLSVQMKQLPGPLTLTGGAVHIDPAAVKLERVGAAILDARALVSGEIKDYRGEHVQVRANVADAVAGEASAHWLWQRVGAPAQFEPRTPLRFAVERATWSPDQAVDAQGSVSFEAGPEVDVDVRWEPGALDVRRFVIRDRVSQATFGLRLKDHLLEAKFSGSIFAQSIAAMFKRAGAYQGQATGDLSLTIDLEHRGRTSAQGYVTAEGLDIDELLPMQAAAQARVNRLDLSADGSSLQIRKAEVSWAQQTATIRGKIARKNMGVIGDVQIDSPGIRIDALLHRGATGEQEPAAAPAESVDSKVARILGRLRQLDVSGQARLHSDFVQFQHHSLAPVTATLTLGEEQAELRLQDTQLCGLSVPMTVGIASGGFTVSAQIQAHKQQLQEVAACLTEERLLLTGEFNASASLTTKGASNQLLTNLQGTVHLESHNGQVRQFALIGNILAVTRSVFEWRLPDLGAEGFPYRTQVIEGHFSQGRFVVDDFVFDSNAFGLAAMGSIGLVDRSTQLTVLVAPFSRITNLVREAPFIGFLLGRTLTSIPVNVQGDIRDPTVVPLDPRAIASGLTALFTRALEIPERMMAPFRSNPEPGAPSTGQ
jgi:AsmA-like protein